MSTIIALIVWAGLIAGTIEGIKHVARALRFRDHPFLVRLLPVLPFILGGPTGAYVLPAAALQWGLTELAMLPNIIYWVLGFGAGGVAGQCWKMMRQTLKGADPRLLR